MSGATSTSTRAGLLLVNLGTPDSPAAADVRRYLDEFLSDPRVLDMNAMRRWLLLNAVILPRRSRSSAEAYEKIWTERGSPLLFHGLDLAGKLRARLGPRVPVELAMRYGKPAIADALGRLRERGAQRIVVFPLFPQYSSAAWGSAVEKVQAEAARLNNVPSLMVVAPFYDHPAFLGALAAVARPVLDDFRPDRVIMSFHGLPERHIRASDGSGRCLAVADCCAAIDDGNRYCYRAHCFATARGIASRLGLADDEVAFQSRLGRDPWIKPYTDIRLVELAKEGKRRVAVLCPAFVADCLETIEEIALRGRADFLAAGGQDLRLVPSLNASDAWADAVLEIARDALGVLDDVRDADAAVGVPGEAEARKPA